MVILIRAIFLEVILKIKNNLLKILSVLILLFALVFNSKTIYLKLKCRNLDYAINYELCNNCNSYNLLRVQNSKIVFLDNDKAVVKAKGLRKKEPHMKTTIECHLKKDFFESWNIENSYDFSN